MKGISAAYGVFSKFDDADRAIVRLAAPLASAATVLLTIIGLATGDSEYLIQAVGGLVIAAVAWSQIAFGTEDAAVTLSVATLVLISTTALVDVPGAEATASTTLAIVGIAGSLLITSHVGWFIAGYSLLIVAANVLWYGDLVGALSASAVTAALFAFGTLIFIGMRNQLVRQAQRYRHLFTQAPVSIWEEDFSEVGVWLDQLRVLGVTDLDSYLADNIEELRHAAGLIEVINVNGAAVELLEADSRDDLVGYIESDRLSHEVLQSYVPQLLAAWNGNDHAVIEVHGAHTMRGSRLEGLLSWTAPHTGDGLDLSSVIVSIVDVTDSRVANEQLQDLVASRDELVATVSHELRTPLTTVVGLAAELKESLHEFSRDETAELVKLISDQSEEVAIIVDDLLAAARAETGSLTVITQPVDLGLEVRGTIKGMGIADAVTQNIEPDIGSVTGDAGRIRQIIRNLLVNAQKYGGPDQRVVVRRDGWLGKIEVRDDGEALHDEEQIAVFERYYRARQTEGVTGSIGLGLAVSRELARMMGGDLTYHHDGEAVFTLALPLTTLPADVLSAATA